MELVLELKLVLVPELELSLLLSRFFSVLFISRRSFLPPSPSLPPSPYSNYSLTHLPQSPQHPSPPSFCFQSSTSAILFRPICRLVQPPLLSSPLLLSSSRSQLIPTLLISARISQYSGADQNESVLCSLAGFIYADTVLHKRNRVYII